MIVASAEGDGGRILLLGLSRANLQKLTAGKPVRVTRATHGTPVPEGLTIGIVFGETEQALSDQLRASGLIGPQTWIEGAPESDRVPGPTGDYPEGRLHPDDRGGVKAALTVDRKTRRLHLDFGTELSWLAMTPEEGLVMAEAMRARAQQLIDEVPQEGASEGETP